MNYKNINPVILIPAYKPDEKLINVVKELIDKGEKAVSYTHLNRSIRNRRTVVSANRPCHTSRNRNNHKLRI